MEDINDMTHEHLLEQIMHLRKSNDNLERALDLYERERARFRHSNPEITGDYFLAGGYGEKDENFLPEYVEIVPAYGCGWTQIYQKTERTVSYEGY
jgi:hypothetical protein